jgi:hypothetical protein
MQKRFGQSSSLNAIGNALKVTFARFGSATSVNTQLYEPFLPFKMLVLFTLISSPEHVFPPTETTILSQDVAPRRQECSPPIVKISPGVIDRWLIARPKA